MPILTQKTIDTILEKATASDLMHYAWKGRGRAPAGYIKGMAVCYGLAVVKLRLGDPTAKAMVVVVNGHHDIFDHYQDLLDEAGMSNKGADSIGRLRHLFVVLTG